MSRRILQTVCLFISGEFLSSPFMLMFSIISAGNTPLLVFLFSLQCGVCHDHSIGARPRKSLFRCRTYMTDFVYLLSYFSILLQDYRCVPGYSITHLAFQISHSLRG